MLICYVFHQFVLTESREQMIFQDTPLCSPYRVLVRFEPRIRVGVRRASLVAVSDSI